MDIINHNMKILWISNVTFPEVCQHFNKPAPVVGGWMQSGAYSLLDNDENLELAIVSLYVVDKVTIFRGKKITYFLVPSGKNNQDYDDNQRINFMKIIHDFKPDLVHIHGSEYPHSYAASLACSNVPFVLSIQGLVSSCSNYYEGGIAQSKVRKLSTFRDYIRMDRIEDQALKMKKRGFYEKMLLSKASFVIGRTRWDRSNVWAYNLTARYYFCNETLRPSFYNIKWKYDECEKYSIFLSQAHYPLKGAHQLFEALPYILRIYPKTKVYIAGINYLNLPWYRINGYARYLKKIIKDNNLENNICFLGEQNETQMAKQYAKAHVFVSPSCIENSPNSVGEAQLVGTPVVASYVGGTMDMVKDGETGFLYRFEEISLLAMRICQLFESSELCESISIKERSEARKRHDGSINAKQLLSIYKDIIKNK